MARSGDTVELTFTISGAVGCCWSITLPGQWIAPAEGEGALLFPGLDPTTAFDQSSQRFERQVNIAGNVYLSPAPCNSAETIYRYLS